MPYTEKQLKWAFATKQPFAERWADEVRSSGYEKKRTRRRRVRRNG